ncbi:MAG: Rpn family recombination-promoting nuclease/putative transposase [Thermoguttaceae bacterium]
MTTETDKIEAGKPFRPHDQFGRKVVGDKLIAADLLRFYADPVIAEFVNLDELTSAPTTFFGKMFDEHIADLAFLARMVSENVEVLFTLELKSQPDIFVPIQLNAYAALALYNDFKTAKRPTSRKKFKPKMLLMVLIYSGDEDIAEELRFQDIYESVPEQLRKHVPQFQVFVINLRKFDYGKLPGRPETRAVVESLKRAKEGTFADHLEQIVAHLGTVSKDVRIKDLIESIVRYCAVTDGVTAQQVDKAILTTIKGQEGIEMAQTVYKGIFADGIAQGEVRGEVKSILTILKSRFKTEVPKRIVNELNSRTDEIALQSLVAYAVDCTSLEDFETALR